jgi:hypothetical protein
VTPDELLDRELGGGDTSIAGWMCTSMISERARRDTTDGHAAGTILTEVCFPLASTFSQKDIRLLSTPLRSLSNADLAKVTACCSDRRQLSG